MSSKFERLSLLGLPQEVRDSILDLLILSERPAPPIPQHPPDLQQSHLLGSYYSSGWEVDNDPRNSDTRSKEHWRTDRNHYPTLLVNRQLHDETQQTIERAPTKHCYKMDIIIMEPCPPKLTWLSLPALTDRIETFRAVIRTCNLEGNHPALRGGLRNLNHHKARYITWGFYDGLDRILKKGSFPSGCDRPTSIKCLELDLITPEASSEEATASDNNSGLDPMEAFFKKHESASLVELVAKNMNLLLGVHSYNEPLADIVLKQVGSMRLFHKGVFHQEWNLAELFEKVFVKDIPAFHSDEHGRSFEKMKAGILDSRVKFGLPVPTGKTGQEISSGTGL